MKIEGNLNILPLIHKFKHGFGALSNGKWASPSGFHISLAGLLGVAGFILAVKDGNVRNFSWLPWGSSDKENSLEESWMVPGLQNLGNNCFLNVILQALASCSYFQTFLQNTVEECESSVGEDLVERFPLTVALASLMEDLCNVRRGRIVLSPRKLLLAMDHCINNFNLASQQDAEEAFFHILSSLREEVSSCYVPHCSSLADVTAIPNCRILAPDRRMKQSEQERWQQSFFGPFDGILGSNLTCESCSFQISLDFQFFHSLHLSPVLCGSADIMPGCSLLDCFNEFFVAERLENYCCRHCWHAAAIKYLSSMPEKETDVGKLRQCSKESSCDCKNIPYLKALPWSNSYSYTFKQLSIARSPKILCIHLQRASMNGFGELIKLRGHVSFPFILNLNSFVRTGVSTKNCEENLRRLQPKKQCQHHPHPYDSHLQLGKSMLNCINGQIGENIYSKTEELGRTALELLGNIKGEGFHEEPSMPQSGGCSEIMFGDTPIPLDNKVDGICHLGRSELNVYRLVSVVEHFGRAASGHYTVYRRARTRKDGDTVGLSDYGTDLVHWFCISDSEVHCVSEKDVLAAEASVLFYERVLEHSESCWQ